MKNITWQRKSSRYNKHYFRLFTDINNKLIDDTKTDKNKLFKNISDNVFLEEKAILFAIKYNKNDKVLVLNINNTTIY